VLLEDRQHIVSEVDLRSGGAMQRRAGNDDCANQEIMERPAHLIRFSLRGRIIRGLVQTG
jgi:hypothetical protein